MNIRHQLSLALSLFSLGLLFGVLALQHRTRRATASIPFQSVQFAKSREFQHADGCAEGGELRRDCDGARFAAKAVGVAVSVLIGRQL